MILNKFKLSILLPVIAAGFTGCHSSSGGGDSQSPKDSGKEGEDQTLKMEMMQLYPRYMDFCLNPDNASAAVSQTIGVVRSDQSCEASAKKLSETKNLMLANQDLTDLSALYEFSSIKSIDLSGIKKFTDIDGLVKAMPQVEQLKMKDSGIPSNKIDQIKKSKKTLKIDYSTYYDANGNDMQGFNKKGFNSQGIHKVTGTEFGPDHLTQAGSRFGSDHKTYDNSYFYGGFDYRGYDVDGFDSNGIHRETGTEFNPGHLTRSGSRFGSDHRTYDHSEYYNGFNYQGYDAGGFNASGIHKDTGTEFNTEHLTQSGSRFGSNHRTYDNNQYYQDLDYQGFNRQGFDQSGNHRNGSQRDDDGYDVRGFRANGTHRNGTLFDENDQNMAGQSRSEFEELQIGKACYIPGPGDYLGRNNFRDLKHFPSVVVNVPPESLDLTHLNNSDAFISEVHNKCKEYNTSVRTNAGESITNARQRHFQAVKQNLIDLIHGGVNPFGGEFNLNGIRRDRIVDEYLRTISLGNITQATRVSFQGESGIDAGGLRKELFRLFIDKLKEREVFKKVSEHAWELNPAFNDFNFCTRAGQARDKQTCFENVGKAIAKIMVVEGDFIDIQFSSYLRQRILDNSPRHLSELLAIAKLDDEDLFQGEIQSLSLGDPSTLWLDFEDLVPNGENVDVDNSNVYLYTKLDLKAKIVQAREEITQHFLTGFHSVLPGGILQASGINGNELDLILRGIPEIKADHIQPLAQLTGNASGNNRNRMAGWFWEIVREIEVTDANFVPQLMIFWTSSRTIPADINANSLKISVQSGRSVNRLPSSHTCFNTLDLSVYNSKEQMKQKLIQAVQLSQGFAD